VAVGVGGVGGGGVVSEEGVDGRGELTFGLGVVVRLVC